MPHDTNKRPSPIPLDNTFATPYLSVRGGKEAIEFYKRAFGAVVTMHIDQPDGRVGHCELQIGRAKFSLADEFPEMSIVGPRTLGGTSVSIGVYVEDVDALAKRAQECGAKLLRPIKDEFYGDRVAWIEDPFGHRWSFSTRIEELSAAEVEERAKQGA